MAFDPAKLARTVDIAVQRRASQRRMDLNHCVTGVFRSLPEECNLLILSITDFCCFTHTNSLWYLGLSSAWRGVRKVVTQDVREKHFKN